MTDPTPAARAERRPIPSFPDYTIDSTGAVFNPKGRQLKAQRTSKGYFQLPLQCGPRWARRSRTVTVHSLVLEAFVGPRPPGAEARHLDGNPGRNELSNLAWGSSIQNVNDSLRRCGMPPLPEDSLRAYRMHQRGERNHAARLTAEAVRDIRATYRPQSRDGHSLNALAQRYGVSASTIRAVVRREVWGHVDPGSAAAGVWTAAVDGAAAPSNPGPSGWGVRLESPAGEVLEFSGGHRWGTNNQAELDAAAEALERIPPGSDVRIISDSTYVVGGAPRAIERGPKSTKKNVTHWNRLAAAAKRHASVKWEWVRGHSGHLGNERADALANAAARAQHEAARAERAARASAPGTSAQHSPIPPRLWQRTPLLVAA